MRDIKFRAWDKQFKEMIDLPFPPRSAWFEKDGEGGPDDFEIMQYTGLKDKNGKEIYEGDILTCEGEKDNRVVAFDRASFFVLGIPLFNVVEDFIEVIGNIYENQELVK